MAEVVLSVFAEAVVSNLLKEVIEQASKFKDKARSVLAYKREVDLLSLHLNKLHPVLEYAMPDHDRLEGRIHVQDPHYKTMVQSIYDIAQDSEDLIQDCQFEKNWWHKMLLPFTVTKRLEDLKRRIERLESSARPVICHSPETTPGCRNMKILSPSISTSFESTTGEFRRTTLRLASMRRNSFKRRLQAVEVDPVGLDDVINEAQRLLIEDEETYIFGIHGMGGSGKSLLMKCVWNSEEVQKVFEKDLLIWVSVSSGQISWLHRTIARDMDMYLSESWPEEKVRAEIYRHLEERRFFMVLDGVWANKADHFLEVLGVPRNCVNGSKIAVISRDREYLRKIKPNMALIEMNHLSDEDSWILFRSYAFGSSGSPLRPEVSQAARKAASKCQGHPLALKAYGAAMAGKRDPWQWQLMDDDSKGFLINAYVDPESRVLQCLRSSYESLSPDLRVAFLYFAAFPENHVVRTTDLIDLWTAERLIRAQSPYLSDAKGRQLLNIMIDRCVVEGVEAGSLGRVRKCKIHPMFRRLAIHILQNEETEEGRSLFQAGDNSKLFPANEINKHRRISLMYTSITSLPEEIKCPKLRTLILRHSQGLSLIPPNFLKQLTSLRTLDLSMTGIESLPVTLGRLKTLEYLNLSRTKLRSLPPALTRLYRLSSLNLFECKELERLPVEMSHLEHLRYLNLRRCSKLKFLPVQVTRIASLQCLIMDGCDALQWKFSPQNLDALHSSQLKDLKSLCNLRYLSFVCTDEAIPDDLMSNFAQMERLEICSTLSESLPENIRHMKFIEDLRVSRCERLLHVPKWLYDLTSLRRITLEYLNVSALPSAVFETLPLLRLLEIENCDELSELPEEFGKRDAFPALEELRVERLKALKELPALEEGAMKMVKELRVRFCEGVTRFPVGVEKLKGNTRIDIVGSCGLIASAGEDGADRHRVAKFLDTITY